MLTTTLLATTLAAAPAFPPASSNPAVDPDAQVDAAVRAADDEPPARSFNVRRAGMQIGSAMALGLGWYQWQIELNEKDFDFDRTWSDQWRRISTSAGYRLDDNSLSLNIGHAFIGTVYHQFARANGGSAAEAMLFDLVASSTWEFGVEHREVISVNDTLMTSLGGVALGESLFALGDYFARSEPTWINRSLMTVFSPGRALATWTGDRRSVTAPTDGSGLAADATLHMALSGGAAHVASDSDPATWQNDLRLELGLVNLASYGKEGRRSRVLHGGEMTRTEIERIGGKDGASHIALSSRATLWGLYRQDTVEVEPAGVRAAPRVVGSATFVGSATSFDVASDVLGRNTDMVAAMHLPGAALDTTLFRDRLTLRANADLSPDFAMVRPWALRDLPTGAARDGMKSTLIDNDYYYAFGATAATRVEAAWYGARTGLDLAFSHFDSIEGLDRHQVAYTNPNGIYHGAVTRDDDLTDQRFKLRVYSEAPLPISNVRVGVSLDYQHRSGTAPQITQSADDVRWGVHAACAL
jgi:hypothetical protein